MRPPAHPQSPFEVKVATEPDVPGLDGASAATQCWYDTLRAGTVVTVESTGNTYRKVDTTLYAKGGRIQWFQVGASVHREAMAKLDALTAEVERLRAAVESAAAPERPSDVDIASPTSAIGTITTRRESWLREKASAFAGGALPAGTRLDVLDVTSQTNGTSRLYRVRVSATQTVDAARPLAGRGGYAMLNAADVASCASELAGVNPYIAPYDAIVAEAARVHGYGTFAATLTQHGRSWHASVTPDAGGELSVWGDSESEAAEKMVGTLRTFPAYSPAAPRGRSLWGAIESPPAAERTTAVSTPTEADNVLFSLLEVEARRVSGGAKHVFDGGPKVGWRAYVRIDANNAVIENGATQREAALKLLDNLRARPTKEPTIVVSATGNDYATWGSSGGTITFPQEPPDRSWTLNDGVRTATLKTSEIIDAVEFVKQQRAAAVQQKDTNVSDATPINEALAAEACRAHGPAALLRTSNGTTGKVCAEVCVGNAIVDYDTGASMAEAVGGLLIRLRQRPDYNPIDTKKEPTMPTPPVKSPVLATLEVDATDAAWRLAGSQFVKLAKEPLVALLSRHLGPDDASLRARLATFLDTELGTALLSAMLSGGLSMVPTPQGSQAANINGRLARELRVKAMADTGGVIADVLVGPLRQVAVMYLQGMPVGPAGLPDVSPSRVSVPDVVGEAVAR